MRLKQFVGLLVLLLPVPAYAVEVKEVVSPGGIRAWLVEEHSQPLLAMRIVFRDAGSATDPKGKEGRAVIAGDLLLEGAGKYDALAFTQALEERAIRLSVQTDEDFTTLSLETLSEHRQQAFALLATTLNQPRLDAEAIERLQKRALVALTQLAQNPSWQLAQAWRKAAFSGHPYEQGGEGTIASLKALKKKDFSEFIHHHLTRGNIIVAVAGDINETELAAQLDTLFSTLPAQPETEGAVSAAHLPATGGMEIVEQNIPQTLVIFGMAGLARNDPDYIPAYVLNQAIGGGTLNSRLGKEIREKRGLAYSIATAMDPMLHAPVWKGGFSTRNEQAGNALQVLKETLEDIAKNGITEGELEDAKRYLTGSFVLSLDSNDAIAAFLTNMQLYGLGRDYLDKRNAMIEAVTQEDIKRVAARFLKPNQMLVVLAGKPEGIAPRAVNDK